MRKPIRLLWSFPLLQFGIKINYVKHCFAGRRECFCSFSKCLQKPRSTLYKTVLKYILYLSNNHIFGDW